VVDTAKVCLFGAGPGGDADLLTVRAQRLLRQAQAVMFDRGTSKEILAMATTAEYMIEVGSGGSAEERTAEVCGWYLRLASSCDDVVRVTLRDPLMDPEIGDELEFLLRHGFEANLVPGVLQETVYECRAAVREAVRAAADVGSDAGKLATR
jgi:siroheme synthase